jgi:DeoR/GlpR family transcriptional regulator of sugar metabolism
MTAVERRKCILELLKGKGIVEVSQLTKQFAVSKVTLRSDLDDLAARGLLVRTHGGAVLPEEQQYVRLISDTINEYPQQKQHIAEKAATLLPPSASVIIDSGSTTVHIADYLKEKHPYLVVTNSLIVMEKLQGVQDMDILLAGGMFRREGMSFMGSYTCSCFDSLHADILFLGASGVSVKDGVTCGNLVEAETKRAMIKRSSIVVLMADSSKIGKTSLAHVCDWPAVDYFVTDSIPDEERGALEEAGVTVLLAG